MTAVRPPNVYCCQKSRQVRRSVLAENSAGIRQLYIFCDLPKLGQKGAKGRILPEKPPISQQCPGGKLGDDSAALGFLRSAPARKPANVAAACWRKLGNFVSCTVGPMFANRPPVSKSCQKNRQFLQRSFWPKNRR